PLPRDRHPRRVRRLAGPPAEDVPGDPRHLPALLRGEPVHLQHGAPPTRRGPDRGGRGGHGSLALRRSRAAGARPHRHRDRLRHDGPLPRGPARRARAHGHGPRGRGGGPPMALSHLPIWPILLPLLVAAVLMLVGDRRWKLKAVIGTGSFVGLLAISFLLLVLADADATASTVSYRVGAWPPSFGIVLVVDRLSAMMLVLTATIAVPTCAFGSVRWQRAGSRFHVLFQLLVMGLN